MAEGFVAEGALAHLGERLRSVRPLGGGCIGEVYRAELEDGTPLVAKVDREGESHLDCEAYMLRYLREKTDLPVPEVFHGSETLLLMEFVEGRTASPSRQNTTPPNCWPLYMTSLPKATATSGTPSSAAWTSRTFGRRAGSSSSGRGACSTPRGWRTGPVGCRMRT